MNPKARITYRFDKQDGTRTEQKTEETGRKANSNVVSFFQEEMKFTSDVASWKSPFQDDAHALEQLIRDADRKPESRLPINKETLKPTASTRDISHKASQPYDDFAEDIILLGDERVTRRPQSNADTQPPVPKQFQAQSYPIIDLDEVEQYEMDQQSGKAKSLGSFKTAANYRPSRGPSWYKVFASVTAAVVTGALFGYFVLALFTSSPNTNQGAGTIPSESTIGSSVANTDTGKTNATTGASKEGNEGKSTAGTTNTQASASNSTPKVKVQVPAVSYYMLQYGVFSNKDGLNAAVKELSDKGLAAAPLTTSDDYRVYVGMTTDLQQAQLLRQTLSDMDVYVKQVNVPALNQIAFTGDKAIVESFFKQSNELISQLDAMAQEGLNASSGAEKSNWTELHQEWTKTAARVEAGIVNKADKTALLKFEQYINTAAVTASEYTKKPIDAHLWSLQTALMEAIFTQKAWFVSIDAL